MTTASIRKKLSDYLLVADDKKIKAIYTLLENDINQSEPVSIEQYNKEIDEAMEAIKQGEVYSHEEVVNMSKSW
jgi:predicted transcriptional regulator